MMYDIIVFECPRFRLSTRKRKPALKKRKLWPGTFFVLMPAILVPGNGNIWIRGEEGLNKCWYFSCREKFVNYIGDLRKHKKQLADVNSQQMEELQVLSKTKIKTITTFFYRLRRQ